MSPHRVGLLILCLCPALTNEARAQEAPAIDVLAARLGDSQLGPEAIKSLAAIGEPATKALVHVLRSTKTAARCDAAKALARIGPDAKDATPDLIKALAAKQRSLRRLASKALINIGPAAIPKLIKALSQQGLTAFLACDILIALGDHSLQDLIQAARKNPHRQTRGLAATALGRLGPLTKDVIPTLINALTDQQAEVRAAAAEALGLIGPKAKNAIPHLTTALLDPIALVRADAAKALGNLGPLAANALPALGGRLADPEDHVQKAAQTAIAKIKAPKTQKHTKQPR